MAALCLSKMTSFFHPCLSPRVARGHQITILRLFFTEKLQGWLLLLNTFASPKGVWKFLVLQLKILSQVEIHFWDTKIENGSEPCTNTFRKFRMMAQRVDRGSRVIFPTLYIFFVLSYFCRYIQPWSFFREDGWTFLGEQKVFSLRV